VLTSLLENQRTADDKKNFTCTEHSNFAGVDNDLNNIFQNFTFLVARCFSQ